MNDFLNENWQELTKELGPPIAEALSAATNHRVEALMRLVPFEDMFPENWRYTVQKAIILVPLVGACDQSSVSFKNIILILYFWYDKNYYFERIMALNRNELFCVECLVGLKQYTHTSWYIPLSCCARCCVGDPERFFLKCNWKCLYAHTHYLKKSERWRINAKYKWMACRFLCFLSIYFQLCIVALFSFKYKGLFYFFVSCNG